jgi:hypothetical protein
MSGQRRAEWREWEGGGSRSLAMWPALCRLEAARALSTPPDDNLWELAEQLQRD